jgi:dihydropteroate synthase
MGILNVTPDSFSDGGQFDSRDSALTHAARMVAEGADILDVGGESTRPGGEPVSEQVELDRIVPVVERLAREFDIPISVDTTKAAVARAAVAAGACVINDISGLRFEPELAEVAAESGAGLILMHSRGERDSLHSQQVEPEILKTVIRGLTESVAEATRRGVPSDAVVLDPGVGFSKTFEQNLELIANFRYLIEAKPEFPWLIGTSRKSFIGRLLNGAPTDSRLQGSMATIAVAILGGAHLVRVHEVGPAVETARVAEALRDARQSPFLPGEHVKI